MLLRVNGFIDMFGAMFHCSLAALLAALLPRSAIAFNLCEFNGEQRC